MKRLYLFYIGLFLLSLTGVKAQYPYYDARKLAAILRNSETFPNLPAFNDTVFQILENYISKDSPIGHKQIIREMFDTDNINEPDPNPYINISGAGQSFDDVFKSVQGKDIISIGSLDVTKLADGMAKFLVERVKAELSVAFFDQFKKDLEDNRDLQTLFPATCNVLRAIDSEIYNYTLYIEMIREAFISDFRILLPNLKKVVEDPDAGYFNENLKLKSIILTGLSIANDIQNNTLPGDIINNLVCKDESNLVRIDTNLLASLQTLNIIIQSLRSSEINQYIVPFDSVYSHLIKDPVCLRMYLGLIYQQSKNQHIYFRKDSLCEIIVKTFKPDIQNDQLNVLANIFQELENKFDDIRSYMEIIKQKNSLTEGKRASYGDYYLYFDATMNLIEYASNLPVYLKILDNTYNKEAYFFAARNLGTLYFDINEKRYATAILKVAMVYDTLLTESQNNKFKLVLKYGNFAAAVAKAETSDDVKNAIETIALPVGSSRFKRETAFSVSINNYTGIAGGYEYFPKLQQNQTAPVIGISAPLGISFNWGQLTFSRSLKSDNSGGNSFSVFISLIDIGALATYRFQNDSSSVASNIELRNIVAPGIYLYYGLKKCPVSIGAGIQAGPQLRNVSAEKINIDGNFYLRAGITLTVDIPVLNLYSKPKNKR